MLLTNTRHLFSVIRSRILPPFISDRKSKHPTFISASYGAEYYRHSFATVKANTRHLFYFSVIQSRILPPFISDRKSKHPTYRAEYYRHSFLTVKANTRHLFYRHTEPNVTGRSFPTLMTNTRHLF